jgi:hypothetical protein
MVMKKPLVLGSVLTVLALALACFRRFPCGLHHPGDVGWDTLVGTPYRDVICSRGGRDNVNGGLGNDVIRGGPGNDLLFGEESDRLSRDAGRDLVFDDAGHDVLRCDRADDPCLQARDGHVGDLIRGGKGNDGFNADASDIAKSVGRGVRAWLKDAGGWKRRHAPDAKVTMQPSGNRPLLFALGDSALRAARTIPARFRVYVRHGDGVRWVAHGRYPTRRIARAARRHLIENGMDPDDVRCRRIHEADEADA